MTHAEFVRAYARGEIRVEMDPAGSARYLSARLLLPLVRLPVLGLGVALMLVGWLFTGIGVFALGVLVPQMIKRSAPHFLFQQALADAAIYQELEAAGLLRVTPVATETPR
jgi:hypothetical protein